MGTTRKFLESGNHLMELTFDCRDTTKLRFEMGQLQSGGKMHTSYC